MNKGKMINNKNALPVLTKQQIERMNEKLPEEFVESLNKTNSLFEKVSKNNRIENKIDEIRQYLDSNLHPLVSPNNWQVYSDLVDMIDELRELINDN